MNNRPPRKPLGEFLQLCAKTGQIVLDVHHPLSAAKDRAIMKDTHFAAKELLQ